MTTRKIHDERLDHSFELPARPQRVVSLLPAATEAICRMGLADRLAGVSAYCHRFVPQLTAPVVGEYLDCNIARLKALDPDLLVTTSGIQRKFALKLAGEGLPVYSAPLPQSFHGLLDNINLFGRLMNELGPARQLCSEMETRAGRLRRGSPGQRPKVYLELWLGRHMRAVGGGSFIHDLVDLAGGDLIFRHSTREYFVPDFDSVAAAQPDIHLFFHEPEFLIDPAQLVAQRGWNPDTRIIVSTVECGRNVIQDGPSFLDTAEWLQGEFTS